MTINKDVIRKLSKKLLKHNKARNIFVVIAIVLTTTLFATIFTSSLSLIKSFETNMMRNVGSTAHGFFANVSEEQYIKLSKHPSVKQFGQSIPIAAVENKELSKRNPILKYGDEEEARINMATPYIGRMPIDKNEVVLDTFILDDLNLTYDLGQVVSLEYIKNDELIFEKFIVSGIYQGDKLASFSTIWLSKENAGSGHKYMSIIFENSFNIKNKLEKIIFESGFDLSDINYSQNNAYVATYTSVDIGTVVMVIILFAIIIFTGYLIIYNIFSVSITKDIRFYGMLKIIGTTPQQIKQIVKRQVLILSVVGIALGLLMGYVIGVLLIPVLMSSTVIDDYVISTSPLIFVLSSVFALVTIYIGSSKPAKIASKATPMEALKYHNVSLKKTRRQSSNSKIYKMAWNNLMRDKKSTVIIIVTLFLSVIILNTSYSIAKGLKFDIYIDFMLESDFTLASNKYYNYNFEVEDSVAKEVVDSIRETNMVKEDTEIYFERIEHQMTDAALAKYKTFFSQLENVNSYELDIIEQYVSRNIDVTTDVYGFNEYGLSKLELRKGDLDINRFLSGHYVVMGAFSTSSFESPYEIGDKVSLDMSGKSKIYEVMGIANLPYSMSVRGYEFGGVELFLPSREFKNPSIMKYIFDVKSGYKSEMEKRLKHYTRVEDASMNYQSQSTFLKEFNDLSKMYVIVGSVIASIIGLIGLANFVNSMLTSILTRKVELAMMLSIGMTRKQLKKMLAYEGLYYGLLSIVLTLTIGVAFNYLLVETFAGQIWFFEYQFTLLPVLIITPLILLVSLGMPRIFNGSLKTINVIDQLRMTD